MNVSIFAAAALLLLLSINAGLVRGILEDKDPNGVAGVSKYKTVSRLIKEILLVRVRRCDLILVNDEYFRSWLVYWISLIGLPTYSISLDLAYNFTIKNLVFKPSGFSQCSNIVVCCWSFKTCRTPNSPILFKMLADNGILKKERRSFVFIANISTPKLYSSIWHENENTSIFSKNGELYSLPEMNKVAYVLKELRSHITLIQRYDPTRSARSSNNYTVLQLLTWTTNWVPGGTPVIPNIYSLNRKMWPTQHTSLKLSIDDYRLGGTVKYCTSSKSLLPMIAIVDEDKESPPKLKGLDAELITMFQRRFALSLEFFEPGDITFEENNLLAGDFRGVISHVIEKQADFGIGQIAYSADRFQSDLQFSPSFFLLVGSVVCTVPDYVPKWKLMILPFQEDVWRATVIHAVTTLIALQIIQKLGRRIYREPGSSNFPWIYFLGPSLQRSIPIHRISKKYSFLFGLGFWLFSCFLLSACYSNILTGVLTFPPRERPIDSLRDLLSSDKTWSVTGLIDETISYRNGELESLAIDRANEVGLVSLSAYDKEAYNLAVESSGCLIAEKNRARYMIATSFTKLIKNQPFALLRISKESFLLGPTGWAIRGDMDFTLQSYFDILFISFRDFGLLEKTKSDISPRTYRDLGTREPSALELEMIQVLFYFLIVGHLMNTLVFIGELACFYALRKLKLPVKMNASTEGTFPFIR